MSGYEQWIADIERRTREIVREELNLSRVAPDGTIGHAVQPNPKSDLERAAEIVAEEEKMWDRRGDRREAWACIRIQQRFNVLPPSPDWRKIAEGLYAVCHGPWYSDVYQRRDEAFAAYDAAVKESQ